MILRNGKISGKILRKIFHLTSLPVAQSFLSFYAKVNRVCLCLAPLCMQTLAGIYLVAEHLYGQWPLKRVLQIPEEEEREPTSAVTRQLVRVIYTANDRQAKENVFRTVYTMFCAISHSFV
jgi:hypothetical protein